MHGQKENKFLKLKAAPQSDAANLELFCVSKHPITDIQTLCNCMVYGRRNQLDLIPDYKQVPLRQHHA